MERGLAFWNGLGLRRQVVLVVATLGVFAAVLGLARIASTPSMALLYSGLDGSAAGEVVAALEAQGAQFDVRGDAIYVESRLRDSLRMTLAGEGLPASGARGYELLDGLSGFGTTSQMFDAAYWRAKEGELARTIVTSDEISSARVHIGTPSSRPFNRDGGASASVTVTTRSGLLSTSHANALRFLVASAVPGLDPEAVAIIDSRGGLISAANEAMPAAEGPPGERQEQLRMNAQRLLEARVGHGNAIVELTIETVNESEVVSERRLDPDSRIAISTETEERTDTATDTRPGAVTVASNLPDGDAAAGDGSSSSNTTETRERVNYEVSETQREIVRQPGDIRRMTVAVLVDGVETVDASGGEVWQPRDPAELEDMQQLVAAAVGLNPERGDTITIRSMQFEPVLPAGTEATSGFLRPFSVDVMSLTQLAVLALVALVLGFGVVRPILTSRLPAPSGSLPPPSSGDLPPLPPADPPALDGQIDFPTEMAIAPGFGPDDVGSPANLPALSSQGDAVSRLRQLIDDRQDETVEILRGWMDEEGAAR